jgi:hypothetical protein
MPSQLGSFTRPSSTRSDELYVDKKKINVGLFEQVGNIVACLQQEVVLESEFVNDLTKTAELRAKAIVIRLHAQRLCEQSRKAIRISKQLKLQLEQLGVRVGKSS